MKDFYNREERFCIGHETYFQRNCEAFPIRGWCVRLYMNLSYVLFGDHYEPFRRHSPDHINLVVAKPILSSHFFVTYALSQKFLVSTFSATRRTHDEHAFKEVWRRWTVCFIDRMSYQHWALLEVVGEWATKLSLAEKNLKKLIKETQESAFEWMNKSYLQKHAQGSAGKSHFRFMKGTEPRGPFMH
jgi:hypothetical protein